MSEKTLPENFNKLITAISKKVEQPYGTNTLFSDWRLRTKYGSMVAHTKEEIQQSIADQDVEALRAISRYYYSSNTSYQRIIDHFTGMFLYYRYLALKNTDGVDEDIVLKKYEKALDLLDNLCNGGTIRTIVTYIFVDGAFYGYVNRFKDNRATITVLDPTYCRSRFKSAYNTDLVEFSTMYLDLLDEEEFRAMQQTLPEEVFQHYRAWKDGYILSPWVVLPAESACAFFLDDVTGMHTPPTVDSVPDILDYEATKENEQEREEMELEKILVQRFSLDEQNDLEMYLEELAKIHEATAGMFAENPYVDVLTSIADDVKLLDSRATNNSVTFNNVTNLMGTKYENAGLSKEIFYATTATALNLSLLNTMSFVGKLNDKIANWLKVYLYGSMTFGSMEPIVEILPVTYYNKDKMVDSYLKAAQNGYSKLMPFIANGNLQSTLIATLRLENDILKLQDKLIPLQTSFTQSGNSNSGTGNSVGRPQKDDSDKTEETIRTSDARQEDRSLNA